MINTTVPVTSTWPAYLAYDPVGGRVLGILSGSGGRYLVEIDPVTGTATGVAPALTSMDS